MPHLCPALQMQVSSAVLHQHMLAHTLHDRMTLAMPADGSNLSYPGMEGGSQEFAGAHCRQLLEVRWLTAFCVCAGLPLYGAL